ncbi:sarcosine oxidase subunit gamma [Zobellella maritima]|uniref:sarcosine oxidase subunit gamma n=1 Tax=Zobellella maritima TaxID=2059725 RepID=UPI000E305B34|nr:sarcosine oxidase subunit gamma family protein [Zobellella maritima]
MSDPVARLRIPEFEVRAESPLHHVTLPGLASPTGEGRVRLRELSLRGHLVLRLDPGQQELVDGVERALGIPLPLKPGTSSHNDQAQLYWISPDEWLLLTEGTQLTKLEDHLRRCLSGHYALVNVSGGQTILELSGPDAIQVLKKSTGYDVHPRSLPVGKSVSTTFAKTQVLLSHMAPQNYHLVVRRSFADYVWLWLQDAGAEYGLTIIN